MIARLTTSLAIMLAGAISFAATGQLHAGDDAVLRGARIAALGNGRGAVPCASCHGFDGAADPSGAFPRLAGQSAAYIAFSLKGFLDGARRNALMTPISKALSASERADVAAYYASVSAPFPPAPDVDEKVIETGRAIANVGLNDQQVPACVACHGPLGRSVDTETPSIAGQYGRYVAFELRMFREGYRKSVAMAPLAKALDEQQIEAVAEYFQRAPGSTGPGQGLAELNSAASEAKSSMPGRPTQSAMPPR